MERLGEQDCRYPALAEELEKLEKEALAPLAVSDDEPFC
jgi:hypothetical protein